MATDALLGFEGFVWNSSDGGHEWYYGCSVPNEEEWREWVARQKKTRNVVWASPEKLDLTQIGIRSPFKVIKAYKEGGKNAFLVAVITNWRVAEQGVVRRRDPAAGRTKSAFQGQPIPIPQWVLDEINDWAGTQYRALSSGKPRPVKRIR